MAFKYVHFFPDFIDELLYVKLTKEDVTKYCGYRKDYLSQNITEMEQELIVCNVCTGIMREPTLCKGDTTCLVCSEMPEKLNSVKGIHSSVSKLDVKCPVLRDCSWNGKLSEAEQHLTICLHFLIRCARCEQIFPRGETYKHNTNFCTMREIDCDYCGKYGIASELEIHLTFCQKYLIPCPNSCGKKFLRKDTTKHHSECHLEVIDCPFAKYGCKSKSMLRRDMLVHKRDFLVEHTDLSLDRIVKLENENVRLNWELKLTKHLDGVEWEIKNLEQLKKEQTIEGPAFYISNYRLIVCATISRVTLKNISLIFLLKRKEGEFDKNLTEAFVSNYRIIIVNEHDHKKSTFLEGSMNYQLKFGSKCPFFEIIYPLEDQKQKVVQDDTLHVRLYFDINTQSPLTSMETQQQDHLLSKIRQSTMDPFSPKK